MALDVNFARMNGLGNMILVADMRGRADSVRPAKLTGDLPPFPLAWAAKQGGGTGA